MPDQPVRGGATSHDSSMSDEREKKEKKKTAVSEQNKASGSHHPCRGAWEAETGEKQNESMQKGERIVGLSRPSS